MTQSTGTTLEGKEDGRRKYDRAFVFVMIPIMLFSCFIFFNIKQKNRNDLLIKTSTDQIEALINTLEAMPVIEQDATVYIVVKPGGILNLTEGERIKFDITMEDKKLKGGKK